MDTPPYTPIAHMQAGKTPKLASLRRLLALTLKTDSEFDAFCLDHFRSVQTEFTDGMARTRKVNILLESIASATVLARLWESHPAAVQAHCAELMYSEDPMPKYRDESARSLGEQLRQLYEQKEEQIIFGADVSALDEKILGVRRLLRQGPQLQAGEYLQDGRFRLMQRIGKGGFATVWLAYCRKSQQRVAVKVLHGQWADDSQRLERFHRGARRMAQLTHPGIVRVVTESQEERGFHYFVMEYVDGRDLRLEVQEHHLSATASLEIIGQVGKALHYAHQQGVIHRDVKPANVLLRPHIPLLTDFDLAWAADTTGGTHTGALGTYLYAAPEMMRDAKEVTPAADVYSLAMTAVFALYGAEPIEIVGDRVGFLKELVRTQGLLNVLRKATERDPRERFHSIPEFCDALAAPDTFAASVQRSMAEQQKPNGHKQAMIGELLKEFRILSVLGHGGMGAVYKAEHISIGKLAAIKILNQNFIKQPGMAQRFLNEARAVNQAKHPGLVDIFDFGTLADGHPFIIMEYLHGETLRARLKSRGGRLPISQASHIARLIAEPLIATHQQSIIHRDLKPENVILVADPQVPGGERAKIFDFGVAVLADSRHLEQKSAVIGTPSYMSPEQCRGELNLDSKVDVYALGVVLMEMLTGRLPFTVENLKEIIMQHVFAIPPAVRELVPSIPREVSELVKRMLAKRPEERPTMTEVAHSLRPFEM